MPPNLGDIIQTKLMYTYSENWVIFPCNFPSFHSPSYFHPPFLVNTPTTCVFNLRNHQNRYIPTPCQAPPSQVPLYLSPCSLTAMPNPQGLYSSSSSPVYTHYSNLSVGLPVHFPDKIKRHD